MTEDFKLKNMEKLLEEARTDNKCLMARIEELQAEAFSKDRTIDQLRHQLKHGVIAERISSTFDHAYDGEGGSIFSG